MARAKKTTKAANTKVRVERNPSTTNSRLSAFNWDVQNNRSIVNLILGAAVLVILGVVLFNFLSKSNNNLGPAQQTENTQTPTGDVAKDQLPGNYTVKDGDTLFLIAQKYYDDGYKFDQIAQANNLTDANSLQVGQVLSIPKLEVAQSSPEASPSDMNMTMGSPNDNGASPNPADQSMIDQSQSVPQTPNGENGGGASGGAADQTIWGTAISGATYTVQPGDWLSKISGRAYGDVMQYQKIAQANNIADPNLIEPGMVLTIPR